MKSTFSIGASFLRDFSVVEVVRVLSLLNDTVKNGLSLALYLYTLLQAKQKVKKNQAYRWKGHGEFLETR